MFSIEWRPTALNAQGFALIVQIKSPAEPGNFILRKARLIVAINAFSPLVTLLRFNRQRRDWACFQST